MSDDEEKGRKRGRGWEEDAGRWRKRKCMKIEEDGGRCRKGGGRWRKMTEMDED